MLTEQELKSAYAFKMLDTLNLSSDDYIIMGSGVMFALGLRPLSDLRDLDLFVSPSTWERVKGLSENIYDERWSCHHLYLFDQLIEMWNCWGMQDYTFQELHDRAIVIGSYPFLSIEDTLDWKKKMGRDKDAIHVKMIEEYLKNQ